MIIFLILFTAITLNLIIQEKGGAVTLIIGFVMAEIQNDEGKSKEEQKMQMVMTAQIAFDADRCDGKAEFELQNPALFLYQIWQTVCTKLLLLLVDT